MTAFLNLALLLIGTTATLAAFGGKTWEEGNKPLIERINRRGWISLACLFFALVLGSVKEFRTEAQAKAAEQNAAAQKLEADKHQAILSSKLAEANLQLKLANKSLQDLHTIQQLTEARLDDARTSLHDVRTNLSKTHDDLSRESTANVVNVLATSDQRVRDITLAIPFSASAKRSKDVSQAFLPKFISTACADLTGVDIGVETGLDHYEWFTSKLGDPGEQDQDGVIRHKHFDKGPPRVDAIVNFKPESLDYVKQVFGYVIGPRGWNANMYVAEINMSKQVRSAAELYAAVSRQGDAPVIVELRWPSSFANRAHMDPLRSRYPQLFEGGAPDPDKPDTDFVFSKRHEYPAACAQQVRNYFGAAFEKAVLIISLNQNQNQSITYVLKAQAPARSEGNWALGFYLDSVPFFSASNSLTEIFDSDWPVDSPAPKH